MNDDTIQSCHYFVRSTIHIIEIILIYLYSLRRLIYEKNMTWISGNKKGKIFIFYFFISLMQKVSREMLLKMEMQSRTI